MNNRQGPRGHSVHLYPCYVRSGRKGPGCPSEQSREFPPRLLHRKTWWNQLTEDPGEVFQHHLTVKELQHGLGISEVIPPVVQVLWLLLCVPVVCSGPRNNHPLNVHPYEDTTVRPVLLLSVNTFCTSNVVKVKRGKGIVGGGPSEVN